jgi:hypothetical protein
MLLEGTLSIILSLTPWEQPEGSTPPVPKPVPSTRKILRMRTGAWGVTPQSALSRSKACGPANVRMSQLWGRRWLRGSRAVRGAVESAGGRGVDWRWRHREFVQKGTSIYLRGHKRSTTNTHGNWQHAHMILNIPKPPHNGISRQKKKVQWIYERHTLQY